ncbi:MAG: DUF2779 domain-containing protein [Synechococcus sp.]
MAELTKSRYLSWLQCPKRLWLEVHQPELQPPLSPSQQRIIDQGSEVGRFAWGYFPGGQLVDSRDRHHAIANTRQMMQAGISFIFEAAFAYQDLYIKCDVLENHRDGSWGLVEVKSATKVKPEHIEDLAFQSYILQKLGFSIRNIDLLRVNGKDCTFPDLSNFFIREPLTEIVLGRLSEFEHQLQLVSRTLAQTNCPDIDIGDRCSKPNPCPFKECCWKHVPDRSIFTIPRLHASKKSDLCAQGILHILDIPTDYPLSNTQKQYVELIRSNQIQIDLPGIVAALSELTYPIHFLDFETINPAIPLLDGLTPYEAYPFQYSCHVLQADGSVDHYEFLHDDTSDPREPLALSLVTHLQPVGSVVAYSASFEKRVLKGLALTFPTLATPLESAIVRLWDQLDIFRQHYHHPGFQGSNSIKRVFPVLCPDRIQYDSLQVQKGDDAQAHWLKMIASTNPADKQQMANALRDYCRLDTQAMVDIHFVLQKLVATSP